MSLLKKTKNKKQKTKTKNKQKQTNKQNKNKQTNKQNKKKTDLNHFYSSSSNLSICSHNKLMVLVWMLLVQIMGLNLMNRLHVQCLFSKIDEVFIFENADIFFLCIKSSLRLLKQEHYWYAEIRLNHHQYITGVQLHICPYFLQMMQFSRGKDRLVNGEEKGKATTVTGSSTTTRGEAYHHSEDRLPLTPPTGIISNSMDFPTFTVLLSHLCQVASTYSHPLSLQKFGYTTGVKNFQGVPSGNCLQTQNSIETLESRHSSYFW